MKEQQRFQHKAGLSEGRRDCIVHAAHLFCGGLLVCRRARTEPAGRHLCTLVNILHLQGVSEAATSQSTLEVYSFLLETKENKHKQIFNRELCFLSTH